MKKNYLEPKLLTVHLSNTDIVTASFTESTTGVDEMSGGSFGAPVYREFDY